jgi:MFS family permease
MSGGTYRSVLRAPGVRWLLTTSLVARLPAAMTGLAIILRVSRGTGSYATAGAVTASYVVGAALLGPVLGRLADRLGRRPVLLASGLVNAAGLILLSLVPVHDSSLLFGVSVLAGASTPPVAASVRSLWPELVDAATRDSLFAVDSTLQELTFVVGPTLVALIGSAGSAAPLVASGLLGLAGTIAVVAHPAVGRRTQHEHRKGTARVLSRPLAALLAAISLLVLGFGALDVGIIGFAGAHHASSQAGLLLGIWSLGSMVGGALFGTRATTGGARSLPPLLAATGAGFALLVAAPNPAVLYPLLLLAGVAIAPSLGCIYGLASRLAPASGAVEAFSWLSSGILAGAAAGAAIGGLIVQHLGSRIDYLAAAGAAVLAAGLTLALPRDRVVAATDLDEARAPT